MELKINKVEGKFEVTEYSKAIDRNGNEVEVEVGKAELTKTDIENEINRIDNQITFLNNRKKQLEDNIK